MAHIFISYAREDEVRIRPLVSALEEQGWSVFWDRHIPAGQTWRSYIGKALNESNCVIVAWSQHSLESNWVSEEADEGKNRGVLIPILLDAVVPPIGFRSIQAADLTDRQSLRHSPSFKQLVQDIKATLGASPASNINQPVEPKPNRQAFESQRHGLNVPSRRITYGVLTALLLALLSVGGWWAYSTSKGIINGKSSKAYESINVDLFFCQKGENANKPLADAALTLHTSAINGKWQTKVLPEEVNSRPGYNIRENLIRYNPDEKPAASELQGDLKSKLNVKINIEEIQYPTPNYLSVFFCSN